MAAVACRHMVDPVAELGGLLDHFGTAAGVDPASAALLLAGALLVGSAVAVTGWLLVGATLDAARSAVP